MGGDRASRATFHGRSDAVLDGVPVGSQRLGVSLEQRAGGLRVRFARGRDRRRAQPVEEIVEREPLRLERRRPVRRRDGDRVGQEREDRGLERAPSGRCRGELREAGEVARGPLGARREPLRAGESRPRSDRRDARRDRAARGQAHERDPDLPRGERRVRARSIGVAGDVVRVHLGERDGHRGPAFGPTLVTVARDQPIELELAGADVGVTLGGSGPPHPMASPGGPALPRAEPDQRAPDDREAPGESEFARDEQRHEREHDRADTGAHPGQPPSRSRRPLPDRCEFDGERAATAASAGSIDGRSGPAREADAGSHASRLTLRALLARDCGRA